MNGLSCRALSSFTFPSNAHSWPWKHLLWSLDWNKTGIFKKSKNNTISSTLKCELYLSFYWLLSRSDCKDFSPRHTQSKRKDPVLFPRNQWPDGVRVLSWVPRPLPWGLLFPGGLPHPSLSPQTKWNEIPEIEARMERRLQSTNSMELRNHVLCLHSQEESESLLSRNLVHARFLGLVVFQDHKQENIM